MATHPASLSNSLRKFFDQPLIPTASNPHKLYGFLDESRVCHKAFDLSTVTREHQFSHSGSIPPLRPTHPDRFERTTQIIPTNNINVVVEPQSIKRLNRKTKPTKTRLHRILHDDSIDAALKIGIGPKEREQILQWVENGEHRNWTADQLMSPKTRRIMHKLDVIRRKQEELDSSNKFVKLKQEWLVPKTHPRGVIGVDTPLLNEEQDTVYYKKQIQERKENGKVQHSLSSQRRNRIQRRTNVNSGLLYHCPERFEHKLDERKLMQRNRRFDHPSLQDTYNNIFFGAIEVAQKVARRSRGEIENLPLKLAKTKVLQSED